MFAWQFAQMLAISDAEWLGAFRHDAESLNLLYREENGR